MMGDGTSLDALLAERGALIRRVVEIDLAIIAALSESLPDPAPPRARASAVKDIQRACRDLIAESGAPMHRSDLYRGLKERGLTVGGRDPLRCLSAHLSHDHRLVPVAGERGMWALRATVRSRAGQSGASKRCPDRATLDVETEL